MQRLIVGISGASGVIMGYRLLQVLHDLPEVETHLVITEGAVRNFALETELPLADVQKLADVVYDNQDLAAPIASGTFTTAGMLIMPCSMASVAGIASGFATNLLLRAADVCIKEERRLVLVPRETPLSRLHLRNLTAAADYGCTIIPPMFTFYNGAATVNQQIDHIIGKCLQKFGITYANFRPWTGTRPVKI